MSAYLGYSTDMASATTDQQRKRIRRFYGLIAGCVLLSVSLVLVTLWASSMAETHPGLYTILAVGTGLSWVPPAALLTFWLRRRSVARHAAQASPALDRQGTGEPVAFEYRSRTSLLGLPLIHVRLPGSLFVGQMRAGKAAVFIDRAERVTRLRLG